MKRCYLSASILIWLLIPPYALAEDDDEFMRAMEAELKKFYGQSSAAPENAEGQDAIQFEAEIQKQKQAAFEDLLRRKYRGTYSIYNRLLDKDKEEIAKAFEEGVPMYRIKRMIIDRLMNR